MKAKLIVLVLLATLLIGCESDTPCEHNGDFSAYAEKNEWTGCYTGKYIVVCRGCGAAQMVTENHTEALDHRDWLRENGAR